jgi:hypothetical protein
LQSSFPTTHNYNCFAKPLEPSRVNMLSKSLTIVGFSGLLGVAMSQKVVVGDGPGGGNCAYCYRFVI